MEADTLLTLQFKRADNEKIFSAVAPLWGDLRIDYGRQETCWVPEYSAQLYQQGTKSLHTAVQLLESLK